MPGKWKCLARRLGLREHIPAIDRSEGFRGRRNMGEKKKLEMLLRVWKEKKPDTFTVECLKTVLAAEVSRNIKHPYLL